MRGGKDKRVGENRKRTLLAYLDLVLPPFLFAPSPCFSSFLPFSPCCAAAPFPAPLEPSECGRKKAEKPRRRIGGLADDFSSLEGAAAPGRDDGLNRSLQSSLHGATDWRWWSRR